ncbi:hypothetical protein HYY75_10955 [bacterium]|nr:hypothetical protein [bacterium]
MLDHDKKVSTTRTSGSIQEVVDHVDHVAEKMISDKDFFPRKNKYCKSCDHLDDCPLKPEILKDDSLISMKKF